ncbi:hypothetical protein CKO41_13895 [Thiococcus pfennigii]|nr:DUF4340 domain-containing protein [Thiococcus pfennigii]MBK1732851.1 hypothetical protein [Thiococcus pfennigii]
MHATHSVTEPVTADHGRPRDGRPRDGRPRPSPTVPILALVLALQLGLALVLSLGRGGLTASPETPLLAFERTAIDRLHIEHTGAEPLTLERRDGRWVIADLEGFPAAEAKVDGLIEQLAGLRKRLPVATSAEAQGRFKVADEGFEGRLQIGQGEDTLATLYLGDAAGFRRRYVRAGDDTAIYEADLGPADTTTRADDWVDRAWLHQDLRDIQRIELPEVTLARAEDGDGWLLGEASDGEQLDQRAAEDLASELALLTFTRVLGTEPKAEYGQDTPVVEWRLALASGETVGYRLSRFAKPDEQTEADAAQARYVLKVAEEPYFLQLPTYAAERLIGATRASLLVPPPAAGGDGASTTADDPAPEPEAAEAPATETD